MRRNTTFDSKGLRCRGWLYVPDDLAEGTRAPGIVMAHGFSAVKEQGLNSYATRFEQGGFVVLVFDYRYLGASEGEPRGQIFWYDQHEDYRKAVTWLAEQPEVDPDRIGIWGTSYSGTHVLYLGAFDKRLKALVCLTQGGVSTLDRMEAKIGVTGIDKLRELIVQDRIERFRSGEIGYLPVVAADGEPASLSGQQAYEWFMKDDAPNWVNQVTIESLEKNIEYDPGASIHRISPTPLLMILAERDTLTDLHRARKVYDRAGEPKKFIVLPCGHFDVYDKEPHFSRAVDASIEWFTKYL